MQGGRPPGSTVRMWENRHSGGEGTLMGVGGGRASARTSCGGTLELGLRKERMHKSRENGAQGWRLSKHGICE